jgi:autotransporter-associated beta strand protein
LTVASGKTATIGTNVTLSRPSGGSWTLNGGGTLNINGSGATVTSAAGQTAAINAGTTVNVTSGSLVNNSSVVVGNDATGSPTLNVNGGSVSISGSTVNLVMNNAAATASPTITISSGSITFATAANTGGIRFGGNASGNTTGTFNLNGGTVTTYYVYNASSGTVNSTFNFNGGTLKALNNNTTTFMTGLTRANVRNGGAIIDANGKSITIGQALEHSNIGGDNATDGGLTLTSAVSTATLTLTGANTYTGPTTINGGKLSITAPYNTVGSSVVANSGGRLRVTVGTSSAQLPPITLNDGGGIEFNLGAYDPANAPGLTNASLIVPNGTTNFVDIAGSGIPVTNIVLLAYTNKTGTGVFQLGQKPPTLAATLTDTGSNLVLNVVAPVYTWSAGTGDWDIGGALNWNSGTTAYAEPAAVLFPDNAGGTVTLTTNVAPFAVEVVVTNLGFYTFAGSGSIGGTGGINVLGTNTVTLGTSNSFTGAVTVSGGSGTAGATLYVNHPRALGATNGGVVVSGPANTLELGTNFGTGVEVTGETVTINGTGVGGARGALRGAATSSGSNVWAGPVIIGTSNSRIGTEDSGNLTVSGNITDNGLGYGVLFRPGASGTVTIAGNNNTWGGTAYTFGSGLSSTVRLGANNAIPANSPLSLANSVFDLNGYNQTSPSLVVNVGGGGSASQTSLTDSGAGATFTLNATNASSSFPGDITGNLSFVKTGTNTFTMSGANLTYIGTTTVSQGRLNISTANPLSTSISVAGGATLAGEVTTTNSLTLNANSTLLIDPATPGSLVAATVAAPSAPVNIAFASAPAVGVPVLVVSSTGGISASPANFQAVGVSGGTFYTTNSGNDLMFVVATSPSLTFSFSNNTLTMSWPGYLGWIAQSNAVSVANSNAWFDIPGSSGVTSLVITPSPSETNVFYRLRSP